jgi:valyl-tRNA synthetase
MQEVQCPVLTDEEMAKQYAPTEVEEKLYEWWESNGYFKPNVDSDKECFVISMPPPNVTGKLHMGHAMFVALEDIMTRFHRMLGQPTLWLPGTDHAGIATQMLVERALREEGIERKDMGREAFLDRVWDWKGEYGGYITGQIRRLGASCDWTREKFTLQPELCTAVTEAFVTLYERGLIYRGEYMVNWSPSLGTAVSDLEVEYSEEEGKLYYFKYKLADSEDEYIPVATTRPETILGDTAVCVNPEDERFKDVVGKEVVVPFLNRRIPVIADDYVKMDFGTGALKITPAHDINDYAIGQRHNLPNINIMNKDATINEVGGKYQGMDRFACREKLWEDMEELGLTLKVEKHMQRVPISQRGGEVIEPLISSQWFVKMDGMAKKGLDAVRDGDIKILPQRYEKVYFNWLENIQDWCISRQLGWGHRIPVWFADEHPGKFFVARSVEEAQEKADAELGPGVKLRQDDDVLDTWFSSGLWPFATVGWPAKEGASLEEYNRFYPSSVMETGYDILFFWVARMVMMGLEFTGKSPFHTIYMHGLVRDGNNVKMSKTKGNVVDPIETIEQYGTDALRISLVTGTTPGQDVPLSMEKVTANRDFANKLWNAGRFIVLGLEGLSDEEKSSLAVEKPMSMDEIAALPLPERWVISLCHQLVASVTSQLHNYDFGPAGIDTYRFLWDEFANWYIEVAKQHITFAESKEAELVSRRTLVYVLDTCLRLLHPYMPYVTETIWQNLPHKGPSIMIAPWPQMDEKELPVDLDAIAQFNSFKDLVGRLRNTRAEYKIVPQKKIAATICATGNTLEFLKKEDRALAYLGGINYEELDFEEWSPLPEGAGGSVVQAVVDDSFEARLPLKGMIDPDKERERLGKQRDKLEKDISILNGKLSKPSFVEKAPAAIVDKTRKELAETQETLSGVMSALESVEQMAA